MWQTDWQDLEVERKPIPGYSPQGEEVKKHPSPREGIQKEAPVGGNGDRESHSTKLESELSEGHVSCSGEQPRLGDWGLLRAWRDGLGRGSQKEGMPGLGMPALQG